MPIRALRSSQACKTAHASGSRATVRDFPPFPLRTRKTPLSRSLGCKAMASAAETAPPEGDNQGAVSQPGRAARATSSNQGAYFVGRKRFRRISHGSGLQVSECVERNSIAAGSPPLPMGKHNATLFGKMGRLLARYLDAQLRQHVGKYVAFLLEDRIEVVFPAVRFDPPQTGAFDPG